MNPLTTCRTILAAAGEQAGVLKRCLRDSIAAACLQGAGFALLLPLFLALGDGKSGHAVLWLAALTTLFALAAAWANTCAASRYKPSTASAAAS